MDKKEKMFSLVDQWRKSGMTRKFFAKQHGIQDASFDYWCKKQYNEVIKAGNDPMFVEITGDHSLSQPRRSPVSGESMPLPQIELTLASGLVIKIYG